MSKLPSTKGAVAKLEALEQKETQETKSQDVPVTTSVTKTDVSVETSQKEVSAQTSPSEEEAKEILESLENQKIPYKRFKEVNDKLKELQAQLQVNQREQALFLENEKLKLEKQYQAQAKEEFSLDNYGEDGSEVKLNRELNQLKEALSKQQEVIFKLSKDTEQEKLSRELARHKEVYQYADQDAVLGWKKVMPERSLEELMELSHKKNEDLLKNHVRALLEKKKSQTQNLVTETKEGVAQAQSEAKPKTLKDARRALFGFVKSLKT